MRELYVIDTCAIISFYEPVFVGAPGYGGSQPLSIGVGSLISEAIHSDTTKVRLSIPSIVFVEIWQKWLKTEEFCQKFFYEVFVPLEKCENVEIRPTDREVFEHLLLIGGSLERHDIHDRLILATAIALEATLVTTDEVVTAYVEETKLLPAVMS